MRPAGFMGAQVGVRPAGVAQAYLPFMLSVKGQLKTIELSLLRYDAANNLFLSKPESAPPLEQKWRVAPLRWSAEREPFCILTHRETTRLRLVVAKPDCACELWPVMYSSERPDGGVLNACSVSPSKCKLVSFMWKGGLYVLAMDRSGPSCRGSILQINSPQEPWTCVRDLMSEWNENNLAKKTRVTPFYCGGEIAPETYMLVQTEGEGVFVYHVADPALPWVRVCDKVDGPLTSSKVQFLYCRTKSQEGWPVALFACWVDGCSLMLARVPSALVSWNLICTVPVPPHSKLGCMYVPFLPEPLLVTTSVDPHYLGSVALRRLFLAERLLGMSPISPPRVIRYMQVPALPVAPRDLTADFPISDLPYREYHGEFVGKRLPYDLTPATVSLFPVIPPPPQVPSHGPIPLLLEDEYLGGGVLASLQGKSRLDWVPGKASIDNSDWRVTPLRWAPGREVLFVVMQSVRLATTRVALASAEKPCAEWTVQCEFGDSAIPFSECNLIPFQYQTMPGASDLFVLALHGNTGKGGLFFVANPKSEWQFIREITEPEMLEKNAKVSVMYHRSKDPASVNLCTFFIIQQVESGVQTIRVLIEPNQATFDVTPVCENVCRQNLVVMYAFSPKPPVTHVWPCEVFAAWFETREGKNKMVVAHISGPDLEWRELYAQTVPFDRVVPVYLSYLAEPILMAHNTDDSHLVDLVRPNLIQAYSENNMDINAKFIQRYFVEKTQVGGQMRIVDTTLDTALVWIPQMGLQGMHPYSGYPLPFEPAKPF